MADNNITSSQNQNGDDDARVSSPRQQQQRPQSSEPGRPGSARPASAQPAAAAAAADDEGKIFISYIVLGVIVTSFVLVTVALGLMAALINLPDCDSTTQRFGRDALVNKNKLTIFKELLDSHKVESARAEYPYCPELLDSPVGQPWNSKRLPGDIVPIRYELMLRTPIFATTMYNGEITIEVEARAATSYIILHSKFLSDYLPSVRNAAGDELSIACTGDFLPYDYYVIKMASPLSAGATYKIDLYFTGSLIAFANGIFDVKYNLTDSEFEGNMLASHFNPVDARLAFPCFDEPQMKAVFSIRLYHPPGTTALSNSKALSEVQEGDEILTTFEDTPRLPVYLIAMLVFRTADFQSREITGANGVELRVWARRTYVESGSVDGPVKMLAEIFNTFDFIANDVPQALPKKLDVFAIPYYPQDSVGHAGLFIFEESKLLFLENNVQERIKQSIALELAKHIASLWFGSYVTFKWWNELWLQESISDYVKYRAVDRAYPTWRVSEQFITEELIRVLVDDSYPSSHPVIKDVDSPEDIDQLFDSVETSKGAAILRMIEYEVGPFDVYTALISYLKAGAQSGIGDANTFWSALEPIRKWPAKDFADRWLLQANYPIISARIEQHDDGLYYFSASQEKFTSEYSVFSGQEPYPSPFGNVWYIPLTCTFGITPTDGETFDAKFDIDAKTFEGLIGDGTVAYKWVHCDVLFAGYYSFDYSVENWDLLGEVLRADNENLTPQDRANIIHNLFVNTYNGRTSYVQLAHELSFLRDETDYLPWKTAVKHVSDMADILEHRRSFLQLSSYFLDGLASVEFSTDLWHATGDHIEELKRETILEFACRMQDPNCLTNTTNLWRETFPTPDITGANTLAPHVRSVVYNYHMQNTYDTSEWRVIVSQYDRIPDIQDRELLVQAISYSRLPWILFRYLDEIGHDQQSFSKLNFFYILELLAKNPLGREIAWNYYRANYAQIVNDFGYENPEIGSTLINIVKTFSDEFNYFELLEFISNTADEANSQARVRAIEIVSSNSVWIDLKEEEIIEAFGSIRRTADQLSPMKRVDKAKLMAKNKQLYDERFTWPLKRKQQQQ